MGPLSQESKPINNTWWRRSLTIAAIKLCKRWRPNDGSVIFLPKNICVKYTYFTHLSEAATMQFISRNTSIPVPKVYCAFTRKEQSYIVMEKVNGEMLGQGWLSRTKESREYILNQLRDMIEEMRRIPPPNNDRAANVDGGTLYDCRLPGAPNTRRRFGPFTHLSDFHRFLRRGTEAHPDQYPEVKELITMHKGTWPLCFTHADLSSLNILVHGDDVVGIIDWETAGWYPSYWEYTTAWNVNPQNEFWQKEVDGFLEPRPTELAMERVRMRYFGDV
jgi:aminoglycoside phosphotransferase